MGISCWVAHKALWSPQNTAIRFQGQTITYARFEQRVAHLAGYLRDDCGVREGDRVAYLGANAPEILDLLFACARLAAIFVPLNSRLAPPQLRVMIENAAPRCLFAGPGFEDLAHAAWTGSSAEPLRFFGPGGLSVDDLIGASGTVDCNPNRDQHVPVLIAYTSGTTGTPKGAVFTQDALTFSAINSNNVWNMRGNDHVLTFLPMFHVGGLLIFSLPAIHIGAQVTIQKGFDPDAVLDEIAQNRVTLMLAPPQFSRALTDHPRFAGTDLGSIRCVGIGSTFVPAEVMQAWFDRGVPTQQNYGLTEGVPILASPWEHARRKSETAGTSVLYCQARVFDESLNRMPPGKHGEIMLRGRSLFSGYWRNPEATQEAFRDGWFATGDIAYADDEGYFHIVDRKKNIVIVGSSNVYPADLERILHEHVDVAEAAVVGVPDPETGEALVACVRLASGAALDAETIRGLFHGRLATYQHPRHIVFVGDFPRTSLGKIQKRDLVNMLRARLLHRSGD
jgi:fatty-acyl-CoA synthase